MSHIGIASAKEPAGGGVAEGVSGSQDRPVFLRAGDRGEAFSAAGRRRVTAIDAARGAAMVFVCLSHFVARAPAQSREALDWLGTVSMIASPTFMLMSGITLGMMYVTQGARFERSRIRLIDRGLFVITAGHLLVLGAFLVPVEKLPDELRRTFITDAIGVAVIVGALLIVRLRWTTRLALAVSLYVAGWMIVAFWQPTSPAARVLKDIAVGSVSGAPLTNSFPIVQWLAIHLAATTVGEGFGRALASGREREIARRWIAAGLIAGVLAVLLKGIYLLVRPSELDAGWWVLYALTTPFTKRPPGLVYMLTVGGMGLILTGVVFANGARASAKGIFRMLATLGQASLFIYIVQFYVYRILVPYIPGAYGRFWPLAFAASVALLWMLGGLWRKHVGNDFFTVGLHAWITRGRVRRHSSVGGPVSSPVP